MTGFTVCMAVLASIGAVTSSVINYLGARDKLRFDQEQGLMKQEIVTLKGDVQECNDDRKRLATRVSTLEDRAGRNEWLAREVADQKVKDDAKKEPH